MNTLPLTNSDLRDLLHEARTHKAVPRVHGNGFIQVDLSDRMRCHVWGPSLPRQAVATPIHDHSFGFVSKCYGGSLINIRYHSHDEHLVRLCTHKVYVARVREGEDTILVPDEPSHNVRLVPEEVMILHRGDSYSEDPACVHESYSPVPAVTVIQKFDRTLAQGGVAPLVYVPLGLTPDNSFNRNAFDPLYLWGVVFQTLVRFP